MQAHHDGILGSQTLAQRTREAFEDALEHYEHIGELQGPGRHDDDFAAGLDEPSADGQ